MRRRPPVYFEHIVDRAESRRGQRIPPPLHRELAGRHGAPGAQRRAADAVDDGESLADGSGQSATADCWRSGSRRSHGGQVVSTPRRSRRIRRASGAIRRKDSCAAPDSERRPGAHAQHRCRRRPNTWKSGSSASTLFNHVALANPNVTFGNPNFGRITVNRRRSAHHAVRVEVRLLRPVARRRVRRRFLTSVFHVHFPLRFTRTRLME